MIKEGKLTDKVEIVSKLPVSRWKEFKDLRLRAFKKEPQAFLTTHKEALTRPPEKWQETLEKVLDGKSYLVFAKLGKKLVGMIGAFQSDADKRKKRAMIYGVYVDQEVRKSGIGNKLMTKIISQIKQGNIKSVNLSVNEEQVPALKFYRKFGFKVVGEEKLRLGDGRVHKELKMEKVLLSKLQS